MSKGKKALKNKKLSSSKLERIALFFLFFYILSITIFIKSGITVKNLRDFSNKKFSFSKEKQFPSKRKPKQKILTAYLEAINQTEWTIYPLPSPRSTANAAKLSIIQYPQLKSCSQLPSQFPIDNYPDADPFLPWIHDVFPSADGSQINFIAQNKRRCHTGVDSNKTKRHFEPQVSLMQSIPVKLLPNNRYKLSWNYEEADIPETRFICRFTPSHLETLSTYSYNYDYVTYRKGYPTAFTKEGFDNHVIWTSQFIFHCPVPKQLQYLVKSGESVINDYATIYVDLIPIRTPPRFGNASDFLPPKYEVKGDWNGTFYYGTEHVLPKIEDSGRWENIPICKPSLLTFSQDEIIKSPKEHEKTSHDTILESLEESGIKDSSVKKNSANKREKNFDKDKSTSSNKYKHTLIGCTWTSNVYQTRKSSVVSSGTRRLKEWITFHLLAGFDHLYIYDNSHAFSNTSSLISVTSQFPSSQVTHINWSARICNNNPNCRKCQTDKGERSSQYAAEASCMWRFGESSKWMSFLDVDEHLVPMGKYKDLKELLSKKEKEDVKVFSFRSFRSLPILERLQPPKYEACGRKRCFHPTFHTNVSILYTYNCDVELPPKKRFNPADKQIWRTNYVLMHYIHYSTITVDTILNQSASLSRPDLKWTRRYKDLKKIVPDELTEATMIHARNVKYEDSRDRKNKIGFPWPNNNDRKRKKKDKDGNRYNCFQNYKVRDYWIPKLHQTLFGRDK